MPAIASYGLTGNAYIDGVLGDSKWAVNSLTYSFPTSGSFYGTGYGNGEPLKGFEALNAAQRTAVRSALSQYSSVANLTFAEIGETSTQHADLRFAESDVPGTAWAYFPTIHAEGGDTWFNNSKNSYDNPLKGNYAYATTLHEIGHALGLEHAHESGMPTVRDSMEYTVMSYRSYVGASTTSGYTNEAGGYAQSLMMYDIAAIQHMYGANFTTNSGSTIYSWSPTTGDAFVNGVSQGAPVANRVFQTVWDGGGTDTYDFSNYTMALKVDLRPGEWTITSTSQLARLQWDGSKVAVGNIANALQYNSDGRSLIENTVGGSAADYITGNIAANVLAGGFGGDTLSGNEGADTILGNQEGDTLYGNFGADTLHGGDGNDLLYGGQDNDLLTGGIANDTVDGGIGTDTAVFSGQRSNYTVTLLSNGSSQIADLRSGTPDGTDIAWNVEVFQFADRAYTAEELTPSTTTTDPVTITPSVDKVLAGDEAVNTLTGGSGNDTLDSRGGSDKLYGLEGSDKLIGGAGADLLDGGAGTDTASYETAMAGVLADLRSPASNTKDAYRDSYVSIENLTGSSYADTLRGNDAVNLLMGGASADKLYGWGGNDTLDGGIGNDYLCGEAGADTLSGGADADTFDFNVVSETLPGARDTIQDFVSGADRIDLRTIDANTRVSHDQAFSYIGASGFTGTAGQLNFASGVLSGDINGDKAADFQINLTGVLALKLTDFYL